VRACKHVGSVLQRHACGVHGVLFHSHACMDWKICVRCRAWLTLGESNDAPEAVKVEILAAEIAARRVNAWCTNDAWGGWNAHLMGWDPFPSRAALAGYLAREIASHDESGRGGGVSQSDCECWSPREHLPFCPAYVSRPDPVRCIGVTQWAPDNRQCMSCGRFGQSCDRRSPIQTLEDVELAMKAGGREHRAAVRTIKRSPRR
jgi:hypothetical protein